MGSDSLDDAGRALLACLPLSLRLELDDERAWAEARDRIPPELRPRVAELLHQLIPPLGELAALLCPLLGHPPPPPQSPADKVRASLRGRRSR